MAMAPPIQLIRQSARRYQVDPRAAEIVAMGEGGLVNRDDDIGDLAGGGSYGPFQLYTKGALPAQYRGNQQAADAWAWSPAGIDYAIRKMAESGARGLTGRQAIETIIRKFERPADPEKSIAMALQRLGGGAGGPALSAGGGPSLSGAAPPPGDNNMVFDLIRAFGQKGPNQTSQLVGAILGQGRDPNPAPASATGSGVPMPSAPPSSGGAQAMVDVINQAERMGLVVRENPYRDKVDPVHTEGSHHYRTLGKVNGRVVGAGSDISGKPEQMAALFQWIRQRYPRIAELIYDPVGSVFDGTFKNKPYGGHGSHLHVGF